MIKTVIFDFFDVIRSDPSKAWFTQHGFQQDKKLLEVVQLLDHGKIDMGEYSRFLSKASGQSIVEISEEFEAVSIVNFEVIELIKKLLRKYKIGLLSNAPSKYIRDILREHDLEKYFNEIVISSEVGYTKPSKEIFDIMLDRLKIDTSEALFIDDNKIHIEGAEKIGIKTIHYKSSTQLKEELILLAII